MPLSRRQLLAASAAALLAPAPARAAAADPRLLVVFLRGGWDVSYSVDAKLGSALHDGPELDEDPAEPDDREAVQTFGASPVLVNPHKRPSVSRFFEAWGPRCAVVNGVWVGSIAHEACTRRVLTGSRIASAPDVASIVGATRGASALVPTLDLGGASYPGALAKTTGRAGEHHQLLDLLEGGPIRATGGERAIVEEHLVRRLEGAIARHRHEPRSVERLSAARDSLLRSEDLRTLGPELAQALRVPPRSTLGGRAEAAIRALQSGLCHVAVLDSGADWDTHTDATLQHDHHEQLFDGLSQVMTRLQDEAMLDDTLVWVVSEMGRTPRRNRDGGTDHAVTTSALLLGPGVGGGRTLGATDPQGHAAPVDLSTGRADPTGTVLRYDHLAASVLSLAGADPARWLPGVPTLAGLAA